MEEEMEVELFYYEAREVDPDYEFDAPMFFDFSREETFAEALLAERWFGAASSYPPSPFVAKLVLREEIMLQNINTSPKPKGAEYMTTSLNDEDGGALGPESAAVAGFIFYNHILSDKFKAKENPLKPKSRGCSTLMRPTASLLAKQIRAPHVGGSRFQMALDQKGKSIPNSSMVENQAAKRQKLEGGHLRKVGDANPQTDFLHKAPAKVYILSSLSVLVKLRITIPREPDFETAHRAQPMITSEFEHTTVAVRRFKARPLNRKILEAPSLPIPKKSTPRLPEFHEFHLKTSERAKQHTSAVSSSSLQCSGSNQGMDKQATFSVAEMGRRESRRPSTLNAAKQDGQTAAHIFKARPLNKKILSSKGDIGVFRNSKRQTTVPMEFNLHTDKRPHHNPPTDLFSKLSLKSETQPWVEPPSQFTRSNPSAQEVSLLKRAQKRIS
ncbi:unnamed protein product [Linum tenue]|uniref:TPX2 central domain-containing protein n=1 Tax=Linum tenue TaxID=586396 RepID=A0AAV0K6S0_9ROSI|nr:unnamed protein product [Linum tenue]